MKSVRTKARKALLNAYNALSGSALGNETLIVSTSGRNDFRCKGFDLFLSALSLLEKKQITVARSLGGNCSSMLEKRSPKRFTGTAQEKKWHQNT